MDSFSGLNRLYDYPVAPSPVHTQRVASYRCPVCAKKISKALYVEQERCDECDEARTRTILRAFSGGGDNRPVTVNKEIGQQLGHVAGVETSRCAECRSPVNFCSCSKSVRYTHYEREWRT